MFILPHLDYGDVIYHKPNNINILDSSISLNTLMERIEKVQYHACLAITGCWKGTSRAKIYEELGLESLNDRRWSHRLFLLYKIHNKMTPSYLYDNLPVQNRTFSRRNNGHLYREYKCKSSKYRNSFFPDVIKSWNNIGSDFAEANSLDNFKNNIFKLIRPKLKSTFDIHDHNGLKFIFQLRVGLSSLKCHKKIHNFSDTPNDTCDCLEEAEDTSHFLFRCKLFSAQRIQLRSNVHRILRHHNLEHLFHNDKLLLYGHHSLSCFENKSLLTATITFIKETERFS